MADTHVLSLYTTNSETIQPNMSTIRRNQILSDSTNVPSKNSQTFSDANHATSRRRRHASLTLSIVRRYKGSTRCKSQSKPIPIDVEGVKAIEDFQQKQSQLSDEQQRRAMYNARQTPLIPLIVDINLSLLAELSEQDDLLMNILTLSNNIDQECSFFEQFKIK